MEAIVHFKKFEIVKWLEILKMPLLNLVLICLGNIVFTIGMNGILIPHGLFAGGPLGVALIIHYLFDNIQIGWAFLIISIPLLLLGWYSVSLGFMTYTIFSTVFFSLTADLIQPGVFSITDPMLASVTAGVICGAGSGIILRSAGSGGGLDVLGVWLNRKYGLPIGPTLFAAHASVLIAGAYLYDLQVLLYSVIFLFTFGKTIDLITNGFIKRKSLTIISDRADLIAESMLKDSGKGVTFLRGEGAFSGTEKRVIYTIVSLTELPKIKNLIKGIDQNAFMVVNDIVEVLGSRFENKKVLKPEKPEKPADQKNQIRSEVMAKRFNG